MTQKTLIIIVIAAVVVIGGVFLFTLVPESTPEPTTKPTPEPVTKPEAIEGVTTANNQFALDFYTKVKDEEKNKEENIFFSPYSLSIALAMTYEGARGKTAEEMEDVFYFPKDNDFRQEAFLSLHSWLTREDTEHELNIANALWAQKDFTFLQEYFDVITTYYQGLIENLDFVGDPEGSRITINQWVEKQTKEKIKDLIPSGVINALTRLILTNAIYFKGEWVQEFNQEDTKKENFYITPEETVKVDMMRRLDEEAEFPYYETEDLQILEMPYSGEETSMLVLLPKEDNLEEVEKQLTGENLVIWQENLKKQRVKVYFPKFKLETKYFLKPTLGQMGMPTAFTEAADFSGMTGKRDLMIAEVIHQAFVEVDEKGTEAAAATAVEMEITAMPTEPVIPVFRADRPFIFLIQEKETGSILFMGRVVNPAL
jgi:serpin B